MSEYRSGEWPFLGDVIRHSRTDLTGTVKEFKDNDAITEHGPWFIPWCELISRKPESRPTMSVSEQVKELAALRAKATTGVWNAPQIGFDIVVDDGNGSQEVVVFGLIERGDSFQFIKQAVRDEGEVYLLTHDNRAFIAAAGSFDFAALDAELTRLRKVEASLKEWAHDCSDGNLYDTLKKILDAK